MNILAINAHPDDIELGCGGILLKATKQGHNASCTLATLWLEIGLDSIPICILEENKESLFQWHQQIYCHQKIQVIL